jgi:predicted outer membrane repeat protein
MRMLLLPVAFITLAACHRQTDEEILDRDDDGFLPTEIGGEDCDDADSEVNPDAAEVCGDNRDNDCDGETDDRGEGDQEVWFDGDGDGLGDAAGADRVCEPGANQVTNADDCDDTDAGIGLEALLYTDEDRDGLGVGAATSRCPAPDLADVPGDCDDSDPVIGGQMPLYDDLDGDGFGIGDSRLACPGANLVDNGFDCDDTDASIGVGTPEYLYEDLDLDGFGGGTPALTCPQPGWVFLGGDCDDTDPAIGVDTPELLFEDLDLDGYGSGVAQSVCPQPGWVPTGDDCDDADPLIGEMTTVYTDFDQDGIGTGAPFAACTVPGLATIDGDCDDTRADIGVGTPEPLYADGDGDGYGIGASQVVCPQPGFAPSDGDCDDGNAAVNPGEIEVECTGVDDDCDDLTPDGPVFESSAEYASIQEGLDLGTADLMVCPGLYAESLVIDRAVAIEALIPGLVVVDPPAGPAVLVTGGGAVSLEGLTLLQGNGVLDQGKTLGGTVAAINAATSLTLTDMAIQSGTGVDYGDHVGSRGPLILIDTAISDGSVGNGDGGCIWAESTLELRGTTSVANCSALLGNGGALWVGGDLTAEDGVSITSGQAEDGGGIWVGGSVILGPNTLLAQNLATGDGGGAWLGGFTWTGGILDGNTAAGSGGGIYTLGSTMQDATLTGNDASFDGGAIYAAADLTLDAVTADGNDALGNGGGVFLSGELTGSVSSVLANNTATLGGGLYTRHLDPQPDTVDPVAADLALVDGSGLTVDGNTATVDGGGLYATFVNLTGVAASGNHAGGDGGGVYLGGGYLTDVVVTGNTADGSGAGVSNDGLSFLWFEGGSIDGNTATGNGGGISIAGGRRLVLDGTAVLNNAGALGGGVFGGKVALSVGRDPILLAPADPVTIAGNSATQGGGVYLTWSCPVGATCPVSSSLYLTGSTIESNTATGDGGGIWTNTTATLASASLIGNNATGSGGGVACVGALCAITDNLGVFDTNSASVRGGGLWRDSGRYTQTDGVFTANEAPFGAAVATTGTTNCDEYTCYDFVATRPLFEANGSLFGSAGSVAYLDGTYDNNVFVQLIDPTYTLNSVHLVEWTTMFGVAGFDDPVSGAFAYCVPQLGGC